MARVKPEDYLDRVGLKALAYVEDYLQQHYDDQALLLAETPMRDEKAVQAVQIQLSFTYGLLSRLKTLISKKAQQQQK